MIKLVVQAQGGWVHPEVTFPNAEVALVTLKRWAAEDEAAGEPYTRMWAVEDEDHLVFCSDRIGPMTKGEVELLDYLYPTCHHGMSADLCMDPMGPNHWGTMEQERMGMLG